MKYIFVAGGVMSSVGKGVATASIAKLLQFYGVKVTCMKIDPYVNVDAGTMNPTEHGEVFVLKDGTECDQDMGSYERFLGIDLLGINYMTTGSVYLSVINKERNLGYGGRCVHVVPDIPLEVLERVSVAGRHAGAEVVVIEIGGTVGDYQNVLFLEAVRMLKFKNPGGVLLVLVSAVPAIGQGGTELKTKPTQHAVRNLNAVGVHPDIVLARAAVPLDAKRKEKLEFMCGLGQGSVISAPDVKNVYSVPLNFDRDGMGSLILHKLALRSRKQGSLAVWKSFVKKIDAIQHTVNIAIVGKYFGTGAFVLEDSYISVIEAIKHASYSINRKPVIVWLDVEEFQRQPRAASYLSRYDGVIIPGGFGGRGVEGKIAAIRYVREHKIPYFGLCYGMQLAVVEYARSVCSLKEAHTTEINAKTPHPVIDIMPEQKKNLVRKSYGATMRLGAYPAAITKGTIAYAAYKKGLVSERHRHRYEVNSQYVEQLERGGLVFSGVSPDRRLMEIAELPKKSHPFFLGTQFHPEFTSRPLSPQPLFLEFIKAAVRRHSKRNQRIS